MKSNDEEKVTTIEAQETPVKKIRTTERRRSTDAKKGMAAKNPPLQDVLSEVSGRLESSGSTEKSKPVVSVQQPAPEPVQSSGPSSDVLNQEVPSQHVVQPTAPSAAHVTSSAAQPQVVEREHRRGSREDGARPAQHHEYRDRNRFKSKQRSQQSSQGHPSSHTVPHSSNQGALASVASQNQQSGPQRQGQQSRVHSQQHTPKQTEPRKPLEDMFLVDLNVYARRLGIVGAALMSKAALIEKIKYMEVHPDADIEVKGVLEKLPDGFGFLRSAVYDYVSGQDDVYVSPSQIRRFNLRTGDMITGVIRKPKEGEKYYALLQVKTVNSSDPATLGDRSSFDRLTPVHPHEKMNLEFDPTAIATRVMDIFTPIGKGQRGLIVAPPKVGKTLLMKEIAQSIIANHPEVHLILLLVDERPEEVADMKRIVKGNSAEVISSTFDETAARHVQVAEIVLERAKRLVETGRDVVILLDSITRLARAYNTVAPVSGKVLTGGIDANALYYPKRFFGAARTVEEGGSLTILASALVDTGSRMEEVIFEEFKGTGNMEINMTRKLANRRIYPAFDLPVSGTRREDLLLPADDLNKVWVLQKLLSTMNTAEGMEFIIDKMKKFKTNREFLDSINKKQPV